MNLDLSKAEVSDYSGLDEHTISSMNTDGPSDLEETTYVNTNWPNQWGYFNQVPELKNAIILKAIWNVGKGWKAKDDFTTTQLEFIKGIGKDTFKNILFSMEITKRIGGDAFAEIIRADDKRKTLINLKPLDPSTIRIVVDSKGMIKRYEQIAKTGTKEVLHEFKPEQIFHLSNNRLADQIHGISDIDAVENVILADDQSFGDLKKLMHFQAKPFIVFKLKTDDTTKISEFAAKVRSARELGEDMFIPDDENLLSYEVIQVNPSSILMAWRDDMRNKFYRTIGLPQIVPGGGGQSTESESKVIYIAFEQIVMHDQLDLEQQIFNQLGIKINLVHPTLIEDLLGVDAKKDGANAINIQPSELTPGKNENGN